MIQKLTKNHYSTLEESEGNSFTDSADHTILPCERDNLLDSDKSCAESDEESDGYIGHIWKDMQKTYLKEKPRHEIENTHIIRDGVRAAKGDKKEDAKQNDGVEKNEVHIKKDIQYTCLKEEGARHERENTQNVNLQNTDGKEGSHQAPDEQCENKGRTGHLNDPILQAVNSHEQSDEIEKYGNERKTVQYTVLECTDE